MDYIARNMIDIKLMEKIAKRGIERQVQLEIATQVLKRMHKEGRL